MNNFDQFGFYTVGPLKTYSKLEAILAHEKSGIHPSWNFNDDAFELIDWKQEPRESLLELYRQRAQQLRDRYDYLVLFYSGGADSTTILQTFLTNDIKLDEIAQFYSLEGDGDPDSNFNAEVTRVAIPWSLAITEKYSWIRHRVIDQSRLIEEIYQRPEIRYDFLYQQNTTLSPNNFSRAYLRLVVKDYQDLIDRGMKLCFIWGSDKPRLNCQDGRYYLYFQDIVDNCVSPLIQQQARHGWFDELFYWSPDFSHGLVKQAHIIRRGLNQLPISPPFFRKDPSPFGSVFREGTQWYLEDHGLHTLIYPGWDINTFSVGKRRSPILSLRDSWYLDKEWGSTHILKSGFHQLDLLLSRVHHGYWKNSTNLANGIKNCYSKAYFLE